MAYNLPNIVTGYDLLCLAKVDKALFLISKQDDIIQNTTEGNARNVIKHLHIFQNLGLCNRLKCCIIPRNVKHIQAITDRV